LGRWAVELVSKAREMIDRYSESGLWSLGVSETQTKRLEEECESPIEQILAAALLNPWSRPSRMLIDYQVEIGDFMRARVEFRADILISLEISPGVKVPVAIVECDGRDAHTREEAIERDKRRDRRITTRTGLPVLRFTGREIFKDPESCAAEVFEIFRKFVDEALERGTDGKPRLDFSSKRVGLDLLEFWEKEEKGKPQL